MVPSAAMSCSSPDWPRQGADAGSASGDCTGDRRMMRAVGQAGLVAEQSWIHSAVWRIWRAILFHVMCTKLL